MRVPTSETASDPRQPRLLEKNRNSWVHPSAAAPPAGIGHVDHLNAVDGVSVDQNHRIAVCLVGQLVTEYDTAAVSQHLGQGLDDLAGRFILRQAVLLPTWINAKEQCHSVEC